MIQSLLAALDTQVVLSVDSPDPERFLNICLQNGIRLRSIQRLNALTLHCRMRAADFRRLPSLVSGRHFRIRILQKSGVRSQLLAYVRRPFFLIGGVLAFLALMLSSQYVWQVSIRSEGISEHEILHQLAAFGLKPGVAIASIDEEMIKEQVIAAIPELSWIGIFMRGSTAEIDYRLRTIAPEVIPLDEPTSVFAARTGVITGLYAYHGQPVVSVGDTVMRGDLMVSAVIPIGQEGNYRLVHALADVEARTWHELSASTSLTADQKIYTGKVIQRKSLIFSGQQINLPFSNGKVFDEYDIIIESRQIVSGFPLTIVTERYLEYVTEPVALDPAAEEARLTDALLETLRTSLKHGQVVSSQVTVSVDSDILTVQLSAECLEDIAVSQPYSPLTDTGSARQP